MILAVLIVLFVNVTGHIFLSSKFSKSWWIFKLQ